MSSKNHKTLRDYLTHKQRKNSRGADWEDLLLTEPFHAARPQQALWRAVILQMVTDAITESKKPEAAAYRRDARRWLSQFTRDFRMVCHYAGYDPSWVHLRIQAFLTDHDLRKNNKEKQNIKQNPLCNLSYKPIRHGLAQQDFSINQYNVSTKAKIDKFDEVIANNECDA